MKHLIKLNGINWIATLDFLIELTIFANGGLLLVPIVIIKYYRVS